MAAKTGIKFGDYHTYDDWGLRLKQIDIDTPEVITNYVDIPGRNGRLDLSEVLSGKPVYDMRTLTFVFDIRNCDYLEWSELSSEIYEAVHGKLLQIVLDTDPDYYYTGRCSVKTEKSNSVTAQVTITCSCDPYKCKISDPSIKIL